MICPVHKPNRSRSTKRFVLTRNQHQNQVHPPESLAGFYPNNFTHEHIFQTIS